METQLLIIKNNEDYIRVKQEGYICCRLDKASVFPMAELNTVNRHVKELKEQGFAEAAIYKLIMTEEPL
ncbi:MAG: hypothetical protein U9N77_09230 [Thermodesulfobacteriota bacterium]|nr:hypothetical protein [Thermodesulfobacteriota bacterium]